MSRGFLFVILAIFSFGAQAEVCEGINACSELYMKLTGEKITIDESVSDEMSLAVASTDLTPQNARGEFPLFLNKNAVNFIQKKLKPVRSGEFLSAPIYVVSPENMPQMINKDGLMSMVYHSKKPTRKLVTPKLTNMLSKTHTKGLSRIVEFKNSKIIVVSDTFEHATNIMTEIMKSDR